MVDFVISQWDMDITHHEMAQLCIQYATFLKQPLKLEMFVPCDDSGNPFIVQVISRGGEVLNQQDIDRYEKAKEKVLFEGAKVVRGEEPSELTLFLVINGESIAYKKDWEYNLNFDFLDIEQLSLTSLDLTLTQSAIKQIGL